MPIHPVVTLGFGSFSTTGKVPTLGFNSLSAVEIPIRLCFSGVVKTSASLSGEAATAKEISGSARRKISLTARIIACTD